MTMLSFGFSIIGIDKMNALNAMCSVRFRDFYHVINNIDEIRTG